MYFVWFDGDRRRGSHLKLADAIGAYQDKFGRSPAICLASDQDARDIMSHARRPAIAIRAADFISPNTYYLGADAELDAADALRTRAA
ncbi:MAG: hypothetical protein H0W23_00440 [Chloroflexia bacterium]|nr:hypothetical protein [Chloroflexia bacterium]